MPVYGTPVSPGSPSTIQPSITTLYDIPILSKMRAVSVKQAQSAILEVQLYNTDIVQPINLTTLAAASISFRFMEAVGLTGFAIDATDPSIVDPDNGIVHCSIPPAVLGNSGVYVCNIAVNDGSTPNNIIYIDELYVWIDKSLFTLSKTDNPSTSGIWGLPTLHSIRTNFRDLPEVNRLLDNYEMDICDICEASVRAISEWNQSQPPIDVLFNSVTFPFSFYLLEGIIGYLCEIAANYYRRSSLKHAGAGVQVDDINRLNEYLQSSQMRLQSWRTWMKMKKIDYNMQSGFSTLSSGYPATQAIYAQGW